MNPHQQQTYNYGRIYAIISQLYPQLRTPDRMRACAAAPLLYTDEYVRLSLNSPRIFGALEYRLQQLLLAQTSDYPIHHIPQALRSLWWLGFYIEGNQTDRIALARKSKGWTQRQLASALGYTSDSAYKHIHRWEKGERAIPNDQLPKLAALLPFDERLLDP